MLIIFFLGAAKAIFNQHFYKSSFGHLTHDQFSNVSIFDCFSIGERSFQVCCLKLI